MISKEMESIHTRIRAAGYVVDSETILEMIAEHNTEAMSQGVRYYRSQSDIVNREMYFYDSQQNRTVDDTKENHKLVNNWHKLLVDQKVSYLVGRPMVFSFEIEPDEQGEVDKKGKEKCISEEFPEKVELLLGDEWDDIIADIATNSSNKGTEWLHVYIDTQGYYKYAIAPAEEIIPVYDSAGQNNLEALMRYYSVQVVNESESETRYRAEWWTRETVTVYIEDDGGEFIPDTAEQPNPAPHFSRNGAGLGWGKVPFIEFPNNSFRAGDLEVTKSLIDEYDKAFSDFANNNAEVQEIVTVLRGYESTDLATFKQNLRYYKTIKLRQGNDSGVDTLKTNIPTEAKKELLDRLEENIFMFGQGVNVKTDRFGNSPSGASLEFLYTLLDLKASMMERKFRRSAKRLLWFTTTYINMQWQKTFDPSKVKASFRKNMVQNIKEMVETLKISRDIISDKSITELHPLVENSAKEYQLLLEQREGEAGIKVDLVKDVDDVDLKEIDINE